MTDEHTIESRTNIILKSNNIDNHNYYDLIYNEIPEKDWQIPKEELSKRYDLRNMCIFTIDPPTAKDLDDALSCERINSELFEVGIHIADVSYFVKPYSKMDKEASKRGTSTYLVQKVIPMLPKELCESICSLNAGQDRLTFSIIIKIDKNGEVIEVEPKLTVICSCAKLSYIDVQRVIDNNGEWPKENENIVINNPHNGYTSEDVRKRINDLYNLSSILKKRRYDKGAISLNRKKLWFDIHQNDSLPLDYGIFEPSEANSLVEEFMLLANISVAKMLYEKYPNESLLRFHAPPTIENIEKYSVFLKMTNKLSIDTTNKETFHKYLTEIRNENTIYSDIALIQFIKFLRRALYTCGTKKYPSKLFHYGLYVPFYTHFTSPIRRYPDIIVHRQLKAILSKQNNSPYNRREIFRIAKRSNDTKMNAKKAQEESIKLYLCYLLNEYIKKKNIKYIISEAIVINFDNYNIEVTIPQFAYEDKLEIIKLYDKDILEGIDISKPEEKCDKYNGCFNDCELNKKSKEIIFDVFWNNNINKNNIVEKYFSESDEQKTNNQQKQLLNPQKNDKKTENINSSNSIDSNDNNDLNKNINNCKTNNEGKQETSNQGKKSFEYEKNETNVTNNDNFTYNDNNNNSNIGEYVTFNNQQNQITDPEEINKKIEAISNLNKDGKEFNNTQKPLLDYEGIIDKFLESSDDDDDDDNNLDNYINNSKKFYNQEREETNKMKKQSLNIEEFTNKIKLNDNLDIYETNTKLMMLKKDLKNYPKQTLKLFSTLYVMIIPDLNKNTISILPAPPDVNKEDFNNYSYQSPPEKCDNEIKRCEPAPND